MPTIVVIEDESFYKTANTLLIESILNNPEVVVFETGDEAIDYLSDIYSEVDLVLTDMNLPGEVKGLDLLRKIQEICPNMPTVVASGELIYGGDYIHKMLSEARFDGDLSPNAPIVGLSKPYNREELDSAMERAFTKATGNVPKSPEAQAFKAVLDGEEGGDLYEMLLGDTPTPI